MSHIFHDAIIITGYASRMQDVADFGRKIGASVLGPSDTVTNSTATVVICPDGSKEGWHTSNEGDDRRAAMRLWLDTMRGNNIFYDWVEVRFGADLYGGAYATYDQQGVIPS